MQPALTLDSHGRANIVAWHGDQLRWARNVGTANAPDFRSRDVPGTTEFDRTPLIALDADDDPTIAWTREPYCGVDPCYPDDVARHVGPDVERCVVVARQARAPRGCVHAPAR